MAVVATESVLDHGPVGADGAVMVCAEAVKVAVAVTLEAANQLVLPAWLRVITQVPALVALTTPELFTAQPVAVEPAPKA